MGMTTVNGNAGLQDVICNVNTIATCLEMDGQYVLGVVGYPAADGVVLIRFG